MAGVAGVLRNDFRGGHGHAILGKNAALPRRRRLPSLDGVRDAVHGAPKCILSSDVLIGGAHGLAVLYLLLFDEVFPVFMQEDLQTDLLEVGLANRDASHLHVLRFESPENGVLQSRGSVVGIVDKLILLRRQLLAAPVLNRGEHLFPVRVFHLTPAIQLLKREFFQRGEENHGGLTRENPGAPAHL